ncbi:MAG TPA: hypothetical protein VFT37_09950 [Telluria sp.]|nr:hypothetical protein [Telluria sp.]
MPIHRPGPNQRAAVFVPHNDADQTVRDAIRNGSGLVGFGNPDGTITVYYENNKFNDSALARWQDKCFKAYDRMTKGAPTVNKLTGDAGNFYQVGLIEGPEIMITDMANLHRWLEKCGVLDSAPEGTQVYAGPAEKRKHT